MATALGSIGSAQQLTGSPGVQYIFLFRSSTFASDCLSYVLPVGHAVKGAGFQEETDPVISPQTPHHCRRRRLRAKKEPKVAKRGTARRTENACGLCLLVNCETAKKLMNGETVDLETNYGSLAARSPSFALNRSLERCHFP